MVSPYVKSTGISMGIYGIMFFGGIWYTVPKFRVEVKRKWTQLSTRVWNILSGNEYRISQRYLTSLIK